MTMPNFLIIGAAKAGTTSLRHYLNQHPQVYMSPVSALRFFAFEGEKLDFRGPGEQERINRHPDRFINKIEDYRAQFQGLGDETAVGEVSNVYLYHPRAPERIRNYIPNVKLIAILRDPVERAYSHFIHLVRDNREPLNDFSQALQEEENRMRNNWGWSWYYVDMGFYYTQLRRYFDTFDRDQIKIHLHDDFNVDSTGVLQDIFHFLNVDDTFVSDVSFRYNPSGIPKNKALHVFLSPNRAPKPIKSILKLILPKGLRQRIHSGLPGLRYRNLYKPPLPPDVRKKLIPVFREDVLKLQDLIQRDLSNWLK